MIESSPLWIIRIRYGSPFVERLDGSRVAVLARTSMPFTGLVVIDHLVGCGSARLTVMRVGRVGIWAGGPWRLSERMGEAREVAAEVEELGYGALWSSGGFEAGLSDRFAGLLDATRDIVVASGIVSIWHASPPDVAAGFAALEVRHPGRFLLGLGASHASLVERLGQSYARPYRRMVDYLAELDAQAPPVPPGRRVLAALGERMLALAGSRTAGAHPYFVPVEHTARARRLLGPGPVLAPEQAVVLETDAARARDIAREHTEFYLRLPNYANNLRGLGYAEEDLAGGGSDRLVDALVAWGDAAAIGARVAAHHDAGADHVCIQVLTGNPDEFPRAEYRELAAAVL
jgi:probable F420-dependent oxidoreductase